MQGDLNTLSLMVHIIKVLAPESPASELQGLASLKQADLIYNDYVFFLQKITGPEWGPGFVNIRMEQSNSQYILRLDS